MFVLLVMLVCGLSAPVPLTATPSPARNVSSSGCVLPKMPANGTYVIHNNDGAFTPGSFVEDFTILEYTCNKGYVATKHIISVCHRTIWTPIPVCEISSTSTPQRQLYGSECALPSYPSHGKFNVSGLNKNLLPGTIVDEYTIITYYCDTNYDASTEKGYVACEAGKWEFPPPICRERCPMVRSFSVDFTCYKSGTEMDCPKFLPYGSVISPSCKSGHEDSNDYLEDLTCGEDGKWDKPTPYCKPDCGLEKPFGEVHMVNSVTVKKDTFPWHVAIFQWDETTDKNEQICGGSIIHTNLVISAAHCFFDPVNMNQIDARYFKVAAGKFLRSWDNDLPENLKLIQKSDVTAIYLPKRYGGDEQNQQSDVALLQLTTPFRMANSVRAVCYELFNERFDRFQTQPGRLGKVAGWGRTENGEPSVELKTLELPVIGYEECRVEMSKYKFIKYLTTDKLCAGHLNGRAMCQGDAGGGLVFPAQDKEGSTRWFLRGVVSNGPLNDDKTSCRSDTYTAFTHIFKMRSWIKYTIKYLRDTTQL